MRKIFILLAAVSGLAGHALAQKYVQVSFSQSPALVAQAGRDTLVCTGHQVLLGGAPSALGGSGSYYYLWSPPDGLASTTVANPVLVPSESKLYMLSVNDNRGCEAISFVHVLVDPCAGVDYKNIHATLSVFPNPSDGAITIRGISSYPGPFTGIDIMDQLGRTVYQRPYSQEVSEEAIHFDTGIRIPGLYFLKFRFADHVITQRLIIQ